MSDGAGVTVPAWAQDFSSKFQGGIAHTFILQGAVDDYVGATTMRPDAFIGRMLSRRVVVYYNQARGIDFAAPEMRTEFFEALDLDAAEHPPHKPLLADPRQALPVLEQAMLHPRLQRRIALIIEYPELIWPQSDYGHLSPPDRLSLATLRRWATAEDFLKAEQVILLITSTATDLHSSLRAASSGVEQVEIPYPGLAERLEFIEALQAGGQLELSGDISTHTFAALTGGLARTMIHDIALRAQLDGQAVTLDHIRARKDQIIRAEFGELLEILEPRYGFEAVGGMAELKDYLSRSVVAPMRGQGQRERMPSGILLAGPPGTGKTFFVSALGREAGCNVVKLNVGRLLGQYVGTSERNLEKALACIRSLVPVIVLIDELDQQFQRGGQGDGGVERRIFGRILEEMSGASGTRRGDVVWFGATNRVDQVDAALRRPGRFDRIVPILPPQAEERWAILQRQAGGFQAPDAEEGRRLLELTDGYTGADLEGVVLKARELGWDAGRDQLLIGDLLEALSLLRPSHAGPEVRHMADQALLHCNDLSLVPPAWRQRAEELEAQAVAATLREQAHGA